MKPTYHYNTVSVALNELKKKGFIYDFNLHEEEIKKNPRNYQIEHVYRYEGNTDPGDAAVVYGIKSIKGEKGVFVSGFSANSMSEAASVLAKICIEGNDLQCLT